jgi:hypothetical protein
MSRFPVRAFCVVVLRAVAAAGAPFAYRFATQNRALAPFQGEWDVLELGPGLGSRADRLVPNGNLVEVRGDRLTVVIPWPPVPAAITS